MSQTALLEHRRFLSTRSVCERLDYSRSALWERVRKDPSFPKPIKIAPNQCRFVEAELQAWEDALLAERRRRGAS